MVPATYASIAIHCVHAQTRCIMILSLKTERFVRTFAMLAINPKASSKTDRLDASSKAYNIPVSSFSMDGNCFMVLSFRGYGLLRMCLSAQMISVGSNEV